MEIRKIDVIGRGKVGRQLSEALSEAGIDSKNIDSRSLVGLRPDADMLILAVSDGALQEMAERLRENTGNPVIAHTSGATPLNVLDGFEHRGVLYPLQSFSPEAKVDFDKVPFLIEASDETTASLLLGLAGKLSGNVRLCSGEQRARFHLAGVFACNFLNEMLATASGILRKAGLDEGLLNPLVEQTVSKALKNGAENVRTGPALRGDVATIRRHLSMLDGEPELKKTYLTITEMIRDNVGGDYTI